MKENNFSSEPPSLEPQLELSLASSMEQEQVQEQLQTEILQSFEKNEYSYSIFKNFSEFSRFQQNSILEGPLRKTNIAVSFGPPAAGKSNLHNQWIMEQVTSLTGEDNPENINSTFHVDGEKLTVYTFTWADAVLAAQKLNLVPSNLRFGEWKQDHLSVISKLAGRAIDIAREGAGDIEGIEGKSMGILGVDVPMSTATKIHFPNGESQIVGNDRFYSIADTLMEDPETSQSTFFVGVLPDAVSQDRRLQERVSLRAAEKGNELDVWSQRTRTRVRKSEQSQAISYFRDRSASVEAATEIAKQMSQLLLYLHNQAEVALSNEERGLLEEEISFIDNGNLLTSETVRELQPDKLELVARELYPHLIKGLQLSPHQFFDGWNRDVEEVHFYPSLSEGHNLIRKIEESNPRLLLP